MAEELTSQTYVFLYLGALIVLGVLKMVLRNTVNKNIASSERLYHFVCPGCGEYNTERRNDCRFCGNEKKWFKKTGTCMFCGDDQRKSPYGFNPEFWVTLFICTLFPPMVPIYFLANFMKKICRNCGHMLMAEDYR